MGKMLLVTDMMIEEAPHNPTQVFHHERPPLAERCKEGEGPKRCDEYGRTEWVHGEEFVDPRTNQRMVVGFTQAIQERLRLPLGAFKGMSEHITKLLRENNQLNREVASLNSQMQQGYDEFEAFASMPWYRRLLFLFVGRRMY